MLRAVIFDFGGVLVRTEDRTLRTTWEQRLCLSQEELESIVFGGETGWDVQLGQIDDEAHWRWIGQRLALDGDDVWRLRGDFFAGDRLDTDLLAYVGRLRTVYQVGLLSNASLIARALFGETYAILDRFDWAVISSEEGVMKPDPRIFHIALERAGVQAHEALFVDDARANVEAARQVGMQALHFCDPIAARDALASLTGVS